MKQEAESWVTDTKINLEETRTLCQDLKKVPHHQPCCWDEVGKGP